MSDSLTWRVLDAAHTEECQRAQTLPNIKRVLRSADEAHLVLHGVHGLLALETLSATASCVKSEAAGVARCETLNGGQQQILLDLYAHAVIFCNGQQFALDKTSTLVGILREVHGASMTARLRAAESYALLKELITRHSVHRPPFCSAVFDALDVQVIDEYVLNSYYRHYTMYTYAFMPCEVADFSCAPLAAVNRVPPTHVTPLAKALPKKAYLRKVEEFYRLREEEQLRRADEEAADREQQLQNEDDLHGANYTASLKAQLRQIREAVTKDTSFRLSEIEAKLATVEAKVAETQKAAASKKSFRKK